jgi:glycosyltransferase involved in cell wall biosynthesis
MSDKLHITWVLPEAGLAGGVRAVGIYAQRLAARGHKVTIVAAARPKNWKWAVKDVFRGHGWSRVVKPDRSHLDALPGVSVRKLGKAGPLRDADVPDADVVVATWWETAHWVAELSANKGAKAYFMQDYGGVGQPLESVARTWELPLSMVTISGFCHDLIKAHTDRPATIVLNGVDLERFAAPPRERQAVPTVGTLWRDLHAKGGDIVLEAVAQAKGRVPELRFIGFGDKPADVRGQLLKDFVWRVSDEQLPGVYGGCDAWLFASRREGFGLPILEAFACRTPVIATPAAAAPQLVSEANGQLLADYEPASMAAAIERLAGLSPEAWRAKSDAARATAEANTWARATDQMEAALARAASGQPVVDGLPG